VNKWVHIIFGTILTGKEWSFRCERYSSATFILQFPHGLVREGKRTTAQEGQLTPMAWT